jgi:hypothetical protein
MSMYDGSPHALPLMSNPHVPRRTSQSASSVTSATYGGAHQVSGLGLAVQRSQQRQELLRDIATGTAMLREENMHMEDILSEEHQMVTNADVSNILRNLFVGKHASSILSSRKPPVRLPFRQYKNGGSATARALMEDTLASPTPLTTVGGDAPINTVVIPTNEELGDTVAARRSHVAAIRGLATKQARDGRHEGGRVNYRVLLDQQDEEIRRIDRDSKAYREMVREVVHSQQRIGEGL